MANSIRDALAQMLGTPAPLDANRILLPNEVELDAVLQQMTKTRVFVKKTSALFQRIVLRWHQLHCRLYDHDWEMTKVGRRMCRRCGQHQVCLTSRLRHRPNQWIDV